MVRGRQQNSSHLRIAQQIYYIQRLTRDYDQPATVHLARILVSSRIYDQATNNLREPFLS